MNPRKKPARRRGYRDLPLVDSPRRMREMRAAGSNLTDIARACGVSIAEAVAATLATAPPHTNRTTHASSGRGARARKLMRDWKATEAMILNPTTGKPERIFGRRS